MMPVARTCCRIGIMACILMLHGTAAAAEADPVALYHDYCSVCHGDAGDGRSHATGLVPPPRDFTSPSAAAELTRERMIASVSEGRPGTAMAPWKSQLEPGQIVVLVDYIGTTSMKPVASAEAGSGRRLYAENCSVCHGDDGRGAVWTQQSLNPPPRDFGSERAIRELTRERMTTSITHGRADTAMPGFGSQLSAADIEAVVDFVRTAFIAPAANSVGTVMAGADTGDAASAGGSMAGSGTAAASADADHAHAADAKTHEHGTHAVAAVMGEPMPHDLQPDLVRGEAFYRTNCTACHGEKGDGQGPRAYFIMPKPRNFTHPAARSTLNRPALFGAISAGSVGTEMPAWRTVLDNQTIADIAEYVFRTFIRPAEAARTAVSAQ